MKTKFILVATLSFCISFSTLAQDPTQKILQGIMGGKNKKAEALPETYAFSWEFKTNIEIEGKKKKSDGTYKMNYLINENDDYYAIEYENEELKKSGGSSVMVMDFNNEAMVIFSQYGDQNMAMLQKLKDPKTKKIKDKDRNYTYTEIGTKTILGYECYGIVLENKKMKATLYFTLDAPVNFSAFFAFSSEAAPAGFSDPELFDVLKDEALLMELDMTDKKKNQSMKMIPISLDQKKTEFHKKDYQFMKMGF